MCGIKEEVEGRGGQQWRRLQRATGGRGGSIESTDASNRKMVVEIVQTVFREGRLAEEAM